MSECTDKFGFATIETVTEYALSENEAFQKCEYKANAIALAAREFADKRCEGLSTDPDTPNRFCTGKARIKSPTCTVKKIPNPVGTPQNPWVYMAKTTVDIFLTCQEVTSALGGPQIISDIIAEE